MNLDNKFTDAFLSVLTVPFICFALCSSIASFVEEGEELQLKCYVLAYNYFTK